MRDELSAASPPLISKKADSYMDRFLTTTITQGYARTTGGNRLPGRTQRPMALPDRPGAGGRGASAGSALA